MSKDTKQEPFKFGVPVDRDLHKAIKTHCVQYDLKVQDWYAEAVIRFAKDEGITE